MKFTKFGIWDDEVTYTIKNICSVTNISSQKLTDWLYSDGMIFFIKEKIRLLRSFKNDAGMQQTGSKNNFALSTYGAFMELAIHISEVFAKDNLTTKYQIIKDMNLLADAAAYKRHMEFYELQRFLAYKLSIYITSHPQATLLDLITFESNYYFHKQKNLKQLAQEINDHQSHIEELDEYITDKFILTGKDSGKMISQFYEPVVPLVFVGDIVVEDLRQRLNL